MVAIRRSNPADRREFNEPNQRVLQPAVGQETVFVGADRLWAVDVNLWLNQEIVWTSTDVFNVAAAPVYAYPGVVKLAELYAADASGTIHALDANTGIRFWTHSFGGPVTALAINENSVFIVGNGLIRAVQRQNGQTQWTQPINGVAMGGPLVTSNRVLVVNQNGGVNFFDAVNGGLVDGASSVPAPVPGGPAVSGAWLLIPASNSTTYAFRGTQ
jgi:outer membrane protein assembly factor BamB